MDREALSKLFEPFYTTKSMGKGTGLGLATVYGIVKQNNGFINVYSEPGHGATFKIYLPRHTTGAEHIKAPTLETPAARGDETILLVEDEPALLKMGQQMLQSLGYRVLTAATPSTAVNIAQEHPGEIHLLITDVIMPEMNGRELEKKLISLHPQIDTLFMSGYTGNLIAHHGMLDEGVNFIEKPFSKQLLGRKVRELMDGR
jgi:CheY-like chemotaxis protein